MYCVAVAINNRLKCNEKPHSRLRFGNFDLNRSFASHTTNNRYAIDMCIFVCITCSQRVTQCRWQPLCIQFHCDKRTFSLRIVFNFECLTPSHWFDTMLNYVMLFILGFSTLTQPPNGICRWIWNLINIPFCSILSCSVFVVAFFRFVDKASNNLELLLINRRWTRWTVQNQIFKSVSITHNYPKLKKNKYFSINFH